jgi:hypothetical protein
MAVASTECLYELNPFGGLVSTHRVFCGYNNCDNNAVGHIRVVDRGWCGNVCEKCAAKIKNGRRVVEDKHLRGVLSEEDGDGQQVG